MPGGMKEYGSIGQRRYAGMFSEEFLRELQGKRGIEVYREMSENDEVCGAILYAIEILLRQTDWSIQPGGDSTKDKECAEFGGKLHERYAGYMDGYDLRDFVLPDLRLVFPRNCV